MTTENPRELQSRLRPLQDRVETALDARLPAAESTPATLHAAMRYAVLGSGKRIRPVLVYTAGELLGAPRERLDAPACAVELIHAYSLAHDDLPAMDDDALRRGHPTCHVAFDEPTAILAGDALQALAFASLAEADAAPAGDWQIRMIATLADAAGSEGMAGGQAIDLAAVGHQLDREALEGMHRRKTGALIRASVALGGLAAEADAADLERLDGYARAIGLAFQVQDDILDVAGPAADTGKTQGADEARNKPTFPALMGLDGARAYARELHEQAHAALDAYGSDADLLRAIATYIVSRDH